jgi:aminopeptidase N
LATTTRIATVLVATLTGLALPGVAGAAPAHPHFTPGAPGVGDPYFPNEGNGGYDAQHYLLDLDYNPATDRLDGRVTLTARATQDLSRFDLDLQGLAASSVSVDGIPATIRQSGQELVVTPRIGLREASTFVVSVRYGGVPTPLGGPIAFGFPYGFIATDDGAFVAAEPNAASTWFPSNDHPSDKATFTFKVRVPAGLTAVANGDLVGQYPSAGHTTWVWDETKPMATYLATATIGRFDLRQGRTPGGIREIVATDPSLPAPAPTAPDVWAVSGAVTDYWSRLFGPYPFQSTGAIVDNLPIVGFSLETQTRPIYSAVRSQGTIAHELSHQWFGDSVSVSSWNNVWMNEGFATYAQWLWTEHTGGVSARQSFRNAYNAIPAADPFWSSVLPGDPKRDTMFDGAVYQRGAMTLGALREAVGDAAFLSILRHWAAEHRYGNGNTDEFIALAEHLTHRHLRALFNAWLFTPVRPTLS